MSPSLIPGCGDSVKPRGYSCLMSTPCLRLDRAALVANWQAMARASGPASCGAALKADAYGLGAVPVLAHLAAAGCRDVFVASWAEAAALGPLPAGVRVGVLHGITPGEMPAALALGPTYVPVLNTAAQIALWRQTGRACDLMVDTGITRLGLDMADLALAEGLDLDTLHSHLACADTPAHPLNTLQLARFREACAQVPARRRALANSAGILLGADWHFDLTRPGLALYGGTMGSAQVAHLEAPVLQVRDVPAGIGIGYGASHVTAAPARIATVALGYADGYPRALAGWGHAWIRGRRCPLVGRVSMDLITLDVTAVPELGEGEPVALAFDLPAAARASGRSEYELLTGLGPRYARIWS